MTEAIKAVIPFVFTTLRLSRVIIDPVASNEASLALAEKLGFTRLGEVNRKTVSFFKHSKQIRYGLTKEQWLKAKKPSQAKAKKKRKKGTTSDAAAGTAGTQVQDEREVTGAEATAEAAKEGGETDVVDSPSEAADAEAKGAKRKGDDAAAARTCRWSAALISSASTLVLTRRFRRCQVPSHAGVLGCGGCDWAFWCSQPCKTAELTYHNGAHYLQCPGKGGNPGARWRRMHAEFKKRPRRLGY